MRIRINNFLARHESPAVAYPPLATQIKRSGMTCRRLSIVRTILVSVMALPSPGLGGPENH
jgi:hypothetical protein